MTKRFGEAAGSLVEKRNINVAQAKNEKATSKNLAAKNATIV